MRTRQILSLVMKVPLRRPCVHASTLSPRCWLFLLREKKDHEADEADEQQRAAVAVADDGEADGEGERKAKSVPGGKLPRAVQDVVSQYKALTQS